MENKIQNLEDELKVLKNEVQAVLLDIKDSLITGTGMGGGLGGGLASAYGSSSPAGDDLDSSFNLSSGGAYTPPAQQVIITHSEPTPEPAPEPPAAEEPPAPEVSASNEQPTVVAGPGSEASDAASSHAGDSDTTFGDGLGGAGFSFGQEGNLFGGADAHFASQGWGPMSEGGAGGQAAFDSDSQFGEEDDTDDTDDEVDLPTLAVLTPWLSSAINSVGKQNLETLVEVYDVARTMPPRLKQAVMMLIDLHGEGASGSSESGESLLRDGLSLLIELDSLLLRHRTGSLESAVLSLLQEKKSAARKNRSRKAGDG